MTEHRTDSGNWVISSQGVWMDGIFACRRGARLAYRLSVQGLYDLWQNKCFVENGNPDGTTNYALTHMDVLTKLRAEHAHS